MVKNVLLLPTLARRTTKQVKDDDDLYKLKVIGKVTKCYIKVTLKVTSENHSRGHSRSNLKNARKDM